MSKIDLIIDALLVAESSVWSAKIAEALAAARELKAELVKLELEPCKCIDEFWCATFDRCKRNE
jgi:hypothetical protein